MKKISIIIFVIINQINGAKADSTFIEKPINLDSLFHHNFSIGSHTTYFNKEIIPYFTATQRFIISGPRRGIGIGYDYFGKISNRKSVGFSAFFANSICSYQYTNTTMQPAITNGRITFNILSISPQYKFYIFRWVNLRVGLPVTYLVSDKFDNVDVAKRVRWYDSAGRSTFSRVYLSYIIDLDFNIYKRFGISISLINGLTSLGTLKTTEYGIDFAFKQKLVSGYITLNYRINKFKK